MNKLWEFLRNIWLIQLLVILLSPWWWVILQRNITVGILVFALSFNLSAYFWYLSNKKLLFSLLILTVFVFSISVKLAFDESIFMLSALDIQQINRRHEFYAKEWGKAYTNRLSLTYYKNLHLPLFKIQRNFFSNLDPNLYFFASHPRERIGIDEFEKYFPIFLPFFLLGFFFSLSRPITKFLLYVLIIAFASSIITSNYYIGPILFFPIINFLITIGLVLSWQYLKGK